MEAGDSYEKIDAIGSGAFGKVYSARSSRTGQIVAVKCFRLYPYPFTTLVREFAIGRRLRHPNVVQLIDVCGPPAGKEEQVTALMVLEYVPWTLTQLIQAFKGKMPRSLIQHIMRSLAAGVAYLHDRNVLHRDLKPDNILVGPPQRATATLAKPLSDRDIVQAIQTLPVQDWRIVLSDFGSLRFSGDGGFRCNDGIDAKRVHTPQTTTYCYAAPEILLYQTNYGRSADLFGLGCILFELVTGTSFIEPTTLLTFDGRHAEHASSYTPLCFLLKLFVMIGTPDAQTLITLTTPASGCSAAAGGETMGDDAGPPPLSLQPDAFPKFPPKLLTPGPLRQHIEEVVGVDGLQLLVQLLAADPNRRPTAHDLLRDPFITCLLLAL